MNDQSDKGKAVAGLAALGGLITGLAGWGVALLAAFNDGYWVGASAALAASALAFGLVANAVFRR